MMDEELYGKINNLLSHLRSSNAIKLIGDFYETYGNAAPAAITQHAMDELQAELDAFRGLTGG